MCTVDVAAHHMARRYRQAFGEQAILRAIQNINCEHYRDRVVAVLERQLGVRCDNCEHIVGRRSQTCFCVCHEREG